MLIGESSIWRERPSVLPTVEREFHSVLLQQEFADIETTDLLSRVLFVELAFNAVLHSALNPGEGSGVFCVQIHHHEEKPPLLTFCVADAGRGIPATLRSTFYDAVKAGKYFPDDGKTIESNIIRFAFENSSSSRLEFPSGIDEAATRGLALVADSLTQRGDLLVQSAGGALKINNRSKDDTHISLDDSYNPWPIPGTQIVGTLRTLSRATTFSGSAGIIPKETPLSIVSCCDSKGNCPLLASADLAQRLVSTLTPVEDVVLIDFGFGDAGVRHLEYLCYPALSQLADKVLIFWNVSTDWSQCEHLNRQIANTLQPNQLPPLFVRGPGDSRFFGVAKRTTDSFAERGAREPQWYTHLLTETQGVTSRGVGVGSPAALSLEDFATLSLRANSHHLMIGFREEDTASGFFAGKIHLLSSRTVTRYFAVASHIASGVDANLKRWLAASVAHLNRLLGTRSEPQKPPVVLGFAGPMRQVMAHIPSKLLSKSRAYTLLTYDVPTREEISSYVHANDDVLLLTDVVSTGSLLNAVAASVLENNARILGVISLVNNRQDANSDLDTIRLGREDVPFHSAADFPHTVNGEQYALTDREYWVDPVTLIPQRQRPWGWDAELDPRVEQTIDLVVDSGAVRCGHVVDGPRHTSVYVDVRALLAADAGEIVRQVRTVCEQRIKGRGWTDFAPKVILYPTGIRRVESVEVAEEDSPTSGTGELNVYATAVGLYCDRLKSIWGKHITLGEIPRVFDPGGNARCSEQVLFQDGPPAPEFWRDVILADDGMWQGITMSAMIRIAVAHGAKRILAAPLLARMTPKEAEASEMIFSVEGNQEPSSTGVCFALPFVLPIPFYSAHECPYELTQRRFRDRDWFSDTVRHLADNISNTLNGRHPTDVTSHSLLFIRSWTTLRSFAELASENEMALEQLGKRIDGLRSDDELLALFSLFLDEWRLLGKARLRQTIAPQVKQKAKEILKGDYDGAITTAALSLLRSQFKEDFLEALPTITEPALKELSLLERTVLHIVTLTPAQRATDECKSFLDLIQDKGPAIANQSRFADKDLIQYMDVVGACGAISLQSQVQEQTVELTPRRAAIKALDIILNDGVIRHDIRPFINPIAQRGETLLEFSAKTFALNAKDWKERHVVYLSQSLLGVLETLRPCLLQMSTHRETNPSHLQYLTSSRPGTLRLAEDLTLMTFTLDYLATGDTRTLSAISLSQTAERLANHLLNENSTLVESIRTLKVDTVINFATSFRDRIIERLKAVLRLPITPQVTLTGLSNVDNARALFVSKELLEVCAAHILHNLETKAFAPLGDSPNAPLEQPPAVLLHIDEERNAGNDPCLVITVKNNGKELTKSVELSARGKRAARNIQLFGGTLERPFAIEEDPWRVAQRMKVCLW